MPRRVDPQPGLGTAVRLLRETADLSQAALGKRAEIHPTWISHIESGRINPTWGNMRRISSGLGVSLGELADAAQVNEGDRLTIERRERPAPAPPWVPESVIEAADQLCDSLSTFRQELDAAAGV